MTPFRDFKFDIVISPSWTTAKVPFGDTVSLSLERWSFFEHGVDVQGSLYDYNVM